MTGINRTTIAWVAVSAALASAPALAQEQKSVSPQVDEAQTFVKQQTSGVVTPWYDVNTNTLTVSPWVIVWSPIISPQVDTVHQAFFKSVFDLNGDGQVSKDEIEKKFEFSLDKFNALYSWDPSVFSNDPELLSIRNNISDLEKRQLGVSQSELKEIKKSIESLKLQHQSLKDKKFIEYFDLMYKKINYSLSNDNEKLLFLSYLPDTKEFRNFKAFVKANIVQDLGQNLDTYKEVSYVSPEIQSKLITSGQTQELSKFSQEDIEKYSASFISFADVQNIRALSFDLTTNNVIEFLSDMNNDGKLSNSDKSEIYWLQLFSVLNDIENQLSVLWEGNKFYENLSYIFALWGFETKISSREELVALLKVLPEVKLNFISWIKTILIQWWDLAYILKDWAVWFEKYSSMKEKLSQEKHIWKIIKKIEDSFLQGQAELTRLKSEWNITDKEYAEKLSIIEKYKLDPSYKDKLLENAISILSQISWTYLNQDSKFNGFKFSYKQRAFSPQNEKTVKKFIDNLSPEIGIASTSSWNMLVIGLAYKFEKEIDTWDNLVAQFWVKSWIGTSNNLLPFISLWRITDQNLTTLKSAWFKDFALSKESFSYGLSFSMLNVKWIDAWFFVWWSEGRLAALELKYSEYAKIIDKAFSYDGKMTLWEYMQQLESKLQTSEYSDISFLTSNLSNIVTTLETLWFDDATKEQKLKNIISVKSKMVSDWFTYYAQIEEEKGWNLTHKWFRVGLLSKASWVPVLPSLWWSKIYNLYNLNPWKYGFLGISNELHWWEKLDISVLQPRLLASLEKFINIDWLSIINENGVLKLSTKNLENIFEFLKKKWISIRLESTESVFSEVSVISNTITIWDVKDMSIFVDNYLDGKRVTIVLWKWWIEWKIALTQEMQDLFGKNFPSAIWTTNFYSKNSVVQNQQQVTQKSFWF